MKKCIIITTINQPTESIQEYAKNTEYDLIIVGDEKTPDSLYSSLRCTYLSLSNQDEIFPTLSQLIPHNSYARKNIGYAYAFINKYDIIYDTDDDNFSHIVDDYSIYNNKTISTNYNFANVYKMYTNAKIWPRGLPLRYIDSPIFIEDIQYVCPIVQGLVDGDPDVDAIFRLINSLEPNKFEKFDPTNNTTYSLKPYVFCPFNTQNTHWFNRDLFYLMYLPGTVSMRFTDILRGYIVEHQLWQKNLNIQFANSHTIQVRNKHNLIKDLIDEFEMFQYTEEIIEWLVDNKSVNIINIYEWLITKNIVLDLELEILKEWNKVFSQ